MFYAHFVLSKRGPLARIWLAAHWDKKLTKAHVFETNLEDTVETIISPQVKMALRTSGHLLLGVVRIYNRKAKYLLADCNEAFVKIKMAFRPGVVDLPEESREAQHNQIYIVEEFPNFDAPLPDITDIDVTRHLTLNQSRIDEITMPDEVPTTLQLDEGFGDMMELGRNVDDHYGAGDLHSMFYKDDVPKQGKDLSFMEGPAGLKDGFGAMDDGGILGESFLKGPGLFGEEQDGGFLGEGASRKSPEEEVPMETAEGAMDNQMMSPAPAPQQPVEEAELLPQQEQTTATDTAAVAEDENKVVEQEREPEVAQPQPEVAQHQQEAVQEQAVAAQYRVEEQPNLVPEQQPQQVISEEAQEDPSMNKDQTTLVANEEEAFALEPLDVTGVKDVRIRRKRKLIVDHLMELDGQTMRDQLKDFNDIVTTLDMAPPTKRLMQWKDMGGVDKLFTFPSRMCGDVGNKIFANNLHITIPSDLIDVTGTQLHEKFGEIPDVETTATTTIVEHEESSIQVARDLDESSFPAAPPQHIDQSNELMLQNKDLSMNQINAPVAYNSEDEYEPYSIGPQSVASNLGGGGSLGAASPANPMPQLEDPLHLPAMGDMFEPDMPPPPAPEAEEPELPEPPLPEEEEGEAYADDVEDLRWNKRTQHLLHHLQRNFKREPEVTFFQLTDGVTRKQAVSKFYSMLVLAKQEATLLAQSHVFGDVYIRQGPKFDSLLM